MSFDFKQPVTAYELIAIIISMVALAAPILKWLHNKFIRRIRFDFLPSSSITLYHNKSGSYLSLGGVYESKNKAATVKDVSVIVTRRSDNANLSLNWSTFPSPVFRKVAGNFETSFETAHPIKVEADSLTPMFVEFSNSDENINEISESILQPISSVSYSILSQPNIQVKIADSQLKQTDEYQNAKISLNDYFFWKPGKYDLSLITEYNNSKLIKKYEFELTTDESGRLRNNIDNILVEHVATFFRLNLSISTVKKDFNEIK